MNNGSILESAISGGGTFYLYKVVVDGDAWDSIMNDGEGESEAWFEATNIDLDKHSWHTPVESEIEAGAYGAIVTHILLAEAALGMPEGAFLRVEVHDGGSV